MICLSVPIALSIAKAKVTLPLKTVKQTNSGSGAF